MRLTVLLLLVATFKVSAEGMAQKLTIKGEDISPKQFIELVKKQTGYSIIYDPAIIKNRPGIRLNMTEMPLADALAAGLKAWDLTYSMTSSVIVINKKENSALFYEGALPPDSLIDVAGRILNDKQEPVPGVTIQVKGSNRNTQTDENGYFVLRSLRSSAVLKISCVNCEAVEIPVNSRRMISVELKASVAKLEEVTVSYNTGYQTISRERSTGAYSKPNDELFKNRSTSQNLLQRLDGLVPGLVINNAPNATQLLIRGVTSVNGERSPLFVVDGIAMNDVSSINPQDVADITVLKDAVAASIWGSRASNGVIVITTKKGSVGRKISVEYDGFLNSMGKPDLHYIPVLNSAQFIQAAKDIFSPTINLYNTVKAYSNSGSVGIPPHEMILYNQYRGLISDAQANASLDSLAGINNVDQIKKYWYRNASLMNHTLSVRGGGPVHSFYGSLSYTDNRSNRPGEENKTYKINARQDFRFNNWLQLYLVTDLTQNNTYTGRNISIDNRFLPYQLFVDEATGKTLSMPYKRLLSDSLRLAYEARSRISLDYNPMDEANYGYTKGNTVIVRTTAGVGVKLLRGLRYEGTFGYVRGSVNTTDYDDAKSYLVRSELVQFTVAPTTASTPVYYLPATGGRYSSSNASDRNWTVRNQLIFDTAWNGRKHQLTFLFGQEAREQLTTTVRSTVRGYNEELQTYATNLNWDTLTKGMAGTVWPASSTRSTLTNDNFVKTEIQTNTVSYYANGAYTFNRKYTINGSWRIDESNLFGRDKSAQNRPVWAVGAKWQAGSEDFLRNVSWLNQLAVRATYGITGNAPMPGTSASFNILSAATSPAYPNGVGLGLSSPANRQLTWEGTRTINFGLDFTVLQYRLSGSVDVYHKRTEDLLGDVQVNGFTGFSLITGNYGDMENKGIELSLQSINILKKKFSWRSLLTLSYNRNKLIKLNQFSAVSTGAARIDASAVVGYPIYNVFAYNYAGLDNLGDPGIYLKDGTVTKAQTGITPDDVLYMGSSQPLWSGGFSNMFEYKGFGLDINMVYNLGHVMRRDVNTAYNGGRLIPSNNTSFIGPNLNAEFDNRWKKPGDEAITDIPSYVSSNSVATSRRGVAYYTKANINVLDASYIKLRDITLYYNLPKSLLNRVKTEAIRLRLQLSNMMLWKANHFDIDPEFHDIRFGTRSLLSNQRTITVGVNIKF